MSAKKSPQDLFPNLFAAKPAKPQAAKATSPGDMRLVQYMMRQMGTRRPASAQPRPLGAARPAAAPARPAAPARGMASRPLTGRTAQR